MATLKEIPGLILAEAASTGKSIWTKIESAMRLYVGGYVKNLADIARGLAAGDITKSGAKNNVINANFLFAQAVSNMSQILLVETQKLINKVIGLLKNAINSALPIAIL